MKKFIALALVMALALCAFAACGGKTETDTTTEPASDEATEAADVTDEATEADDVAEEPSEADPTVEGGWTINTEFGEAAIPEEAKAAFDKAMEGFAGTGYTPVAYLGSQVVAGVNYAFLCVGKTVVPGAEATLNIVKVYADLEGNTEITDTKAVAIAAPDAEGSVEFNPETLAGGWNVADACGAGLTGDVNDAFTAAAKGLMGVSYEPIALLGTQVVAGQNCAVLCKAATVTAEPATALAVAYMYIDLEGNAQFNAINGFEF